MYLWVQVMFSLYYLTWNHISVLSFGAKKWEFSFFMYRLHAITEFCWITYLNKALRWNWLININVSVFKGTARLLEDGDDRWGPWKEGWLVLFNYYFIYYWFMQFIKGLARPCLNSIIYNFSPIVVSNRLIRNSLEVIGMMKKRFTYFVNPHKY